MSRFIVDLRHGIYHVTSCPYVKKADSNKKYWVHSDILGISNYFPCRHCRSLTYIFNGNKGTFEKIIQSKGYTYRLTSKRLYLQSDIAYWRIGFSSNNE